jgi:cysteine synthase A
MSTGRDEAAGPSPSDADRDTSPPRERRPLDPRPYLDPARPRPAPIVIDGVLELVGETALVELARLDRGAPRGRVLAKMEQQNPGGSVKDRICLAMLEAAIAEGALAPGGVVIEPTSGNTGIGLAVACAAKGFRCVLTMPASMSLERRQLLEAYGATVVLTEPELQMEGAIAKARELVAATPGAFAPSQFDNPENPRTHERTTALEIVRAMEGLPISAFVAGVGTGGTVSGVGARAAARAARRARDRRRARGLGDHLAWRAWPDQDPGLGGGLRARQLRRERGRRGAHGERSRRLRHEGGARPRRGPLGGHQRGGGRARRARRRARARPQACVVTVLCDTGERYFSLDEHFEGHGREATRARGGAGA